MTSVELSPEQRARVQHLLEEELSKASQVARAAGVSPSALADLVDERRRILQLSADVQEQATDPEPPGER
jgi:hypothetical protein